MNSRNIERALRPNRHHVCHGGVKLAERNDATMCKAMSKQTRVWTNSKSTSRSFLAEPEDRDRQWFNVHGRKVEHHSKSVLHLHNSTHE